ncbi:MAG: parallel beta-helix domain-containing protein [Ginsengibacter sp.]
MKKLFQLNQRKSSFLNSIGFISFFFLSAIIFTGCKKDISQICNDLNYYKAKSKGKVIIVQKGGSIQSAVDAASNGEIILVEGGVYKEAIIVNKPGIQIIGISCGGMDKVVIQNPGGEDNGILVRDAGDGFVLRNVTIRDFKENGVFMIRADNYLLSHVVTIDNGEYGLFPIFCKGGLIEYCTASGHTDTGIYVGQSDGAVMEHNIVFANVNGLEIENCSNVRATNNKAYDNVCGILVVLLPGLTTKTSSNIIINNNQVYANNHINFADSEGGFEAFVPSGSGILIVGVDNVTVKNNVIKDNNFVGVATVSTLLLGAIAGLPPEAFADIEPNSDGTQIKNNKLANNGSAPPPGIPLPGVDLLWDGTGLNNCWSGNQFSSSYPSPLPGCN